MDAKKCDRCGNYFEKLPKARNQILIRRKYGAGKYDYDSMLSYDLCLDCMSFLRSWLNGKEGGDKNE